MKPLALALLLGWGAMALAASATPGQQIYEAGERAFHQHRWEEARRAFAAAYELDRKPELLYDVAVATWRLAKDDETVASLQAARAAYRRYLDEASAGRRRKPAEAALAEIEARLPPPKPPAPPPVRDEDDDPARPLDPYAPRHLPPIPKPIIIAPPKPVDAPPKPVAAASLPPLAVQPPPPGMVEVEPEPDEVPGTRVLAPAADPKAPSQPPRRWVTPVVVIGALCVVGLAVGLGVGLSQSGSSSTNKLGTINQ